MADAAASKRSGRTTKKRNGRRASKAKRSAKKANGSKAPKPASGYADVPVSWLAERMATKAPAQNTVGATQLASLLDVTQRRIQQLATELLSDGSPVILRAGRGRYALVPSVRGYIRYLRGKVINADAPIIDLSVERRRLTKARASLAELEEQERRGQLIPASQVDATWSAIASRVRQNILALPDRAAPVVYDAKTIPETREHLRKIVNQILEEISEAKVRYTAHNPRASGSGAADGDDAGGAAPAA